MAAQYAVVMTIVDSILRKKVSSFLDYNKNSDNLHDSDVL